MSGTDAFAAGTRVRIKGIQSQPQLNGTPGTLVSFDDEKGRWKVACPSSGFKMLKPENLELATASSDKNEGQVAQSRSDDGQISTVMINAGVGFVKRNPIKMLLWLVGLLKVTLK